MNATARLSDPLLPRNADGFRGAAVFSMVTHGALIAALALGVQWRTQPVEVVAAELWAAVPQSAAQPAPEPEPAPTPTPKRPPAPAPAPAPAPVAVAPKPAEPDAQIALERRKAEREKVARQQEQQASQERLDKQAREERERVAAETKAAKQREENLKRMLGAVGSSVGSGVSSGTAAADAAPSRSYAARLVAHIKPNIVFTETLSGNPTAEVEVRVAGSGTIISRRLQKSSGVKEWDEAVLRAIDRTGSLPRDVDGRVPPLLIIGFRPND